MRELPAAVALRTRLQAGEVQGQLGAVGLADADGQLVGGVGGVGEGESAGGFDRAADVGPAVADVFGGEVGRGKGAAGQCVVFCWIGGMARS